jgi:hypothetical protein
MKQPKIITLHQLEATIKVGLNPAANIPKTLGKTPTLL